MGVETTVLEKIRKMDKSKRERVISELLKEFADEIESVEDRELLESAEKTYSRWLKSKRAKVSHNEVKRILKT